MSPNNMCDFDNSQVELDRMTFAHRPNKHHEKIPFQPPDEQLINRIVEHVEAYFDENNLKRNQFMTTTIRKKKDGFVNLKLITKLCKVRPISKDWRVVAHAIRVGSSKLEINQDGTCLRRKEPLHPVDRCCQNCRTVYVTNLPQSRENIDQLLQDFAQFGPICGIRIIKPNFPIHPSHAKLLNYLPGPFSENKAIGEVEFNRKLDAQNFQKNLPFFYPDYTEVKLHIVGEPDQTQQDHRTNSILLENLSKHATHKNETAGMYVLTITTITSTSNPELDSSDWDSEIEATAKCNLAP